MWFKKKIGSNKFMSNVLDILYNKYGTKRAVKKIFSYTWTLLLIYTYIYV